MLLATALKISSSGQGYVHGSTGQPQVMQDSGFDIPSSCCEKVIAMGPEDRCLLKSRVSRRSVVAQPIHRLAAQ